MIKPICPQMRIGFRVYQLGVHTDLVTRTPDAPLQHIAHPRSRPICLALTDLSRYVNTVLREITNMPAIRDKSVVRSSVMPSAKYCWSGSLPRLANGKTTIDSRGATAGWGIGRAACTVGGRQSGDGCGAQRIDPHRPRDVLDALLAQILNSIGQLVADLVAHHPRDAETA